MICSPQGIGNLAAAMAKMQGKLTRLVPEQRAGFLTKKGAELSYAYADLADGWDLLRPLLCEAEIAVFQPTRIDGQRIIVETILAHSSGEWITGDLAVPLSDDMRGAQAVGSAITYARRYGLWSMAGIAVAEDDDDGRGASPAPKRQDAADTMKAEELLSGLDLCLSVDECEAWRAEVREKVNALPGALASRIINTYKARLVSLRGRA